MRSLLILLVFFYFQTNNLSQDNFSKIFNLQGDLPSLGTHFQIMDNELLVFSIQLCLDDNGKAIDCTGIYKMDFKGEILDVQNIKNFKITRGDKTIIERDSLFLMVDDSVEGRNKINILKLDKQKIN